MSRPRPQRTGATELAELMVRHSRVLNYQTPRDIWREQAEELLELLCAAGRLVVSIIIAIYGSRNW